MRQKSNHNRNVSGLTLVEMVVATSAMVVILMTMVPALAGIRNSWDTRQVNAEIIQNARVLADHLQRHLATASQITAVSASTDDNGTIEFIGTDGGTYRYAVGPHDYVQFGPTGNLTNLAGPVSRFQLTCYDGNDFATPTAEPARVQFVTAIATFANSAALGLDKTFTCGVYLRTAAIGAEEQEMIAPGIALKDSVSWDGVNAVIDSYRSSEGAYNSARAGANTCVSVNAIASGAVGLSGAATIRGSVYIGPQGNPDSAILLTGGAAVTGMRAALNEPVSIPGLAVPAGLSFAAYPGGRLRLTGNAEETISANYEVDEMQLRGNSQLVVDGDVTLLVNEAIDIKEWAQITVLSGANLTILARDTIDVSGSASVNPPAGVPMMLRIYVIGSNKDLVVDDDAVVQAVVQNPYGGVAISGSSQLLGKIKAARLVGGGQIHMDLDSDF
ncbi:MAG: hypothetical protein JSW27_25685 [Phycisphaerales bacterium]|nr:MAG: hypothetical protein JSW27_25685 [Phycisphaerales bacterium]